MDWSQVEVELESVRVQLEEESEARLDIERQLVKANGEVSVWRSKYETEANARAEEVINVNLKFAAKAMIIRGNTWRSFRNEEKTFERPPAIALIFAFKFV